MALADSLATRAQSLGQTLISNLSQWYANGVFYSSDMSNYHLQGMPHAALMATLSKYTTSSTLKATYLKMISEIVERSLATNANAASLYFDGAATSGVFSGFYGQAPTRAGMGTVLTPQDMIEQVANLAWILNALPTGSITADQRRRWIAVCQANCDYLDTWPTGSITTYWINGNYQAHLLNTYWFTALISDANLRPKYEDMYERALAFMVNPGLINPSRWTGYGLIIDVAGAQYDYSDYQGHLVEVTNNSNINPSPTNDWNYTATSLDVLSRLYVLNRDTRVIRVINALEQKIEASGRLNTSTWILDGTGGSRQNNASFNFGYLPVMAMVGAKGTNTTLMTSVQILNLWDNAVIANMTTNSTNGFYQAGVARHLGTALASIRECANMSIVVPAS